MDKSLICFTGIFRNEAPVVKKTFDSVAPYVDKIALIDTESTDGTMDVLISENEKHRKQGSVTSATFVDYSTTRNKALELAQSKLSEPNALFTLMLSADEVLEGGEALRKFLWEHENDAQGAYCVTMQSGTRQWPYARVLRNGGGWRYVGKVHERPVGPKGEVEAPLIPGVRIVHTGSDPERKAKRLREFDLPLLEAEVNDDTKTIEERAHPLYFLGETLTVMAGPRHLVKNNTWKFGEWMSLNLRAMGYYFRYAQLAEQEGSTAHDQWKSLYATFMYLHLADECGIYTSSEMIGRLEALCSAAPRLAEAHFLLARHTAQEDARRGLHMSLKAAAVAKDVLENPGFEVVDTRLEWLCLMLAAQCAKELKKHIQARELAEKCIAAGGPKATVEGCL